MKRERDAPLGSLTSQRWDVVVVGAGPAGSLLARELALRGLEVLLLDAARFPRAKVCGGCLNRVALAALQRAGLSDLPARLGAPSLARLRLAAAGHQATIPLGGGAACSREALDTALARAASAAGAAFLDGTRGTIATTRADTVRVTLAREGERAAVMAPVVVAATGLAEGSLGNDAALTTTTAADSRIGAGVVTTSGAGLYEHGVISMAHGPSGYVGVVVVEEGRLNLGAAFDPAFVKESGGAGAAATSILESAGLPVPQGLAAARWKGTPRLTVKRRPVALERVFLLGDAAGYEEPFTGEGMGWAMSSALAIAPLVAQAATGWTASIASRWEDLYDQIVGRRARLCHAVAAGLRRGILTRAAVRLLGVAPALAAPLVWAINAPPAESPAHAAWELGGGLQ